MLPGGQEPAGDSSSTGSISLRSRPGSADAAGAAPRRRTTPCGAGRRNSRTRTRPWAASLQRGGRQPDRGRGGWRRSSAVKGPVGAGVARDQVAEWVLDRVGEGARRARWDRHPRPSRSRPTSSIPPSAPRRPSDRPPLAASRRRLQPGVDVGTVDQSGPVTSPVVSGPSRRSRSATPSASRARRSSTVPLQLGLDLGSTSGSSSSRSSARPSSSAEQALVEGERGGPAFARSGSRPRT